ncbi:hypothetical protein BDB01DRAFT_831800 [Pilobolus umbonatus]|nr:hypothetical protein BDB01DRAFT_831800 [Pilobolus umbonatus]
MSDYQRRITDLLTECQNEWVNLEMIVKDKHATPAIHQANKDLREGIKKLVELQDKLDEIGSIVNHNSEWTKHADKLMNEVRKQLEYASNASVKINPISTQSSPLRLSNTKDNNITDPIKSKEEGTAKSKEEVTAKSKGEVTVKRKGEVTSKSKEEGNTKSNDNMKSKKEDTNRSKKEDTTKNKKEDTTKNKKEDTTKNKKEDTTKNKKEDTTMISKQMVDSAKEELAKQKNHTSDITVKTEEDSMIHVENTNNGEEIPTEEDIQIWKTMEDLKNFDIKSIPSKRPKSKFSMSSSTLNSSLNQRTEDVCYTLINISQLMINVLFYQVNQDMGNIHRPKPKSLFPLLKGLRSSQSTPVLGGPAQINFYKNDNEDNEHFVYASDATVDHPLKIGVGYGSYVCYNCTVLNDKMAPITVIKRYSDFVDLREALIKQYPLLKKSIPKLPPKKMVGKFTPTFVEQRRRELEYFFKYVVLHPTLGASSVVKNWISP